MRPRRIIITGANGTGKSHAAARICSNRPELPSISLDAIKLTTGWQRRSGEQVQADLQAAIAQDAWIIEGGPSLLKHALPRAEAVLWLDPPTWLRAWRLAARPWRNFGKTRAELPDGNADWPLPQYRFAFQSLKKTKRFRETIADQLCDVNGVQVVHCRNAADLDNTIARWS